MQFKCQFVNYLSCSLFIYPQFTQIPSTRPKIFLCYKCILLLIDTIRDFTSQIMHHSPGWRVQHEIVRRKRAAQGHTSEIRERQTLHYTSETRKRMRPLRLVLKALHVYYTLYIMPDARKIAAHNFILASRDFVSRNPIV